MVGSDVKRHSCFPIGTTHIGSADATFLDGGFAGLLKKSCQTGIDPISDVVLSTATCDTHAMKQLTVPQIVIIERVVDDLRELTGVEAIVLGVSHARGRARLDSPGEF